MRCIAVEHLERTNDERVRLQEALREPQRLGSGQLEKDLVVGVAAGTEIVQDRVGLGRVRVPQRIEVLELAAEFIEGEVAAVRHQWLVVLGGD